MTTPITDFPDEYLWGWIDTPPSALPFSPHDAAVELVRRERERCAAVYDDTAGQWGKIDPGAMAAEECAARIRELK